MTRPSNSTDPTTWAGLVLPRVQRAAHSGASPAGPDPHAKVSDPCIYSPGLRVWSRTSTCANRTPRMGSGPLYVGSGPLTAGSRDSKTEHTQALVKAQAGVRCRHVSGPYRIHFCTPPRRRPDAAAWPTARDVSQRAEPGVRPLGYAASAFIADTMYAYPFHWQAARPVHVACTTLLLIINRTLPRKQSPPINTAWTAVIIAPDDYSGVISINYPHNVFHSLCSRAHMSGLSTLVCSPP
jgi:hypothetical protein